MGSGTSARAMAQTDYQKELERIEAQIAGLAPDALTLPLDTGRATDYASMLYQRSSLTGDLKSLRHVERVIDEVIQRLNHPGDLLFLKANLAFKLHRLDDVAQILRELDSTPETSVLRADLDFQSGRYRDARDGYEEAVKETPAWDNLARLAHLTAKMEGSSQADELYQRAEDELTAKQMRSFAWIELQRGVLDMENGSYAAAGEHYRKAHQAYSGYWLVEQHAAALSAAEGHLAEAAEQYCRVAERVPKPEIQEAIGKLYLSMEKKAEAEPWLSRAEAEYLESAASGEIHYLHHLADFYLHAAPDADKALYWAARDAELRDNFSTQSVLALALFRSGKLPEAAAHIEAALASGAVDHHIFSTAAQIFRALGRTEEAARCSHVAAENGGSRPHFHFHH